MSYEFHITRADSYLEDSCPVTLDEILSTCERLPEGFFVDRTVTAVYSSGKAECLVYKSNSAEDKAVHIYFVPGCPPFFSTSCEELLPPVIRLAERLGAKVQGDEEEVYTLRREGEAAACQ